MFRFVRFSPNINKNSIKKLYSTSPKQPNKPNNNYDIGDILIACYASIYMYNIFTDQKKEE